jgi:hypothetical protein
MKPDPSSVDAKLAAISRGILINRCLLIFAAVCAGLPLFAPRLAVRIAEVSERIWTVCAPHGEEGLGILASLLVLFFCAAYVVSRIKSPPPPNPSQKPV